MSVLRFQFFVLLTFVIVCSGLHAQESGVLGYWQEPGGSVIHVDHCGTNICLTLVTISRSAPSRFDVNNADASMQKRPLCGLRIGEGFQSEGPLKANSGTLYDPKSGKTYHGRMESHGDKLSLRGYVGLAVFGRTETWARTTTRSCTN